MLAVFDDMLTMHMKFTFFFLRDKRICIWNYPTKMENFQIKETQTASLYNNFKIEKGEFDVSKWINEIDFSLPANSEASET